MHARITLTALRAFRMEKKKPYDCFAVYQLDWILSSFCSQYWFPYSVQIVVSSVIKNSSPYLFNTKIKCLIYFTLIFLLFLISFCFILFYIPKPGEPLWCMEAYHGGFSVLASTRPKLLTHCDVDLSLVRLYKTLPANLQHTKRLVIIQV